MQTMTWYFYPLFYNLAKSLCNTSALTLSVTLMFIIQVHHSYACISLSYYIIYTFSLWGTCTYTYAYLSVYWRLEGIILFKINPFSFLIFAGINVCYVHMISDPPSTGDTFG